LEGIMENTVEKLTISCEEARKQLGVSRGSIYQAVNTGQIPSIRVGRRILIPVNALRKLLEEPTGDQKTQGSDGNQ